MILNNTLSAFVTRHKTTRLVIYQLGCGNALDWRLKSLGQDVPLMYCLSLSDYNDYPQMCHHIECYQN